MEVDCESSYEVVKRQQEEEPEKVEATETEQVNKTEQEELNNTNMSAPNGDGVEKIGSFNDGSGSLDKKVILSSSLTNMAGSALNTAIPTQDQLTLLYGESVLVFDAIPAEKVREIMLIATAAAKSVNSKKSMPGSPVLTRSPSVQSSATASASPPASHPIQTSPLCRFQAELPIARRHSLQRFFEKRRDRLVSKRPYPPTVENNVGWH